MSDHPEGLVGGSIERRIATSRILPIAHPNVLAPFRRVEDQPLLESFLASGPLQIEVGFGRSHHLLDLAAMNETHRILGFEIRRQWVRQAARGAERRELSNVRVIEGDARPFLTRLLKPESVSFIHILFPDPWWKRRHHKRRVFSEAWLNLASTLLVPGGSLVCKTDVPAYADLMEQNVGAHGDFRLCGTGEHDAILCRLPKSHREKKCAEYRIPVYAYRYIKETT